MNTSIMNNLASLITSTQALIHDSLVNDLINKNISSTPFLFPKSISIVPPNTLSLDLILPNALSTGAISGQYGAKNLICRSRSLILFIVFIDECVLALSRMMMGGLVMSLLLNLLLTSIIPRKIRTSQSLLYPRPPLRSTPLNSKWPI